MRPFGWCATRLALLGLLGVGFALGCGGLSGLAGPFRYWDRPAADDPWSRKIARWQERERAQAGVEPLAGAPSTVGAGPGVVGGAPEEQLRAEYLRFRADHRRSLARAVAAWLQEQSKRHYVPDGVLDRWATFEETLAQNGDDCDGLELLAYHLLRDLGFRDDEVYRAIVLRPADGQHHMVTMWFEDAADPWVIDPTGAMTAGMPRMSEVAGWVPLKVFSERVEFSVDVSAAARERATAVPLPPQ